MDFNVSRTVCIHTIISLIPQALICMSLKSRPGAEIKAKAD
jgi:hypothetical protein